MGLRQNTTNVPPIKNEGALDQCIQSSSSSQCQVKREAELQRVGGLPQLQQISHNLATDLYSVSHLCSVGSSWFDSGKWV